MKGFSCKAILAAALLAAASVSAAYDFSAEDAQFMKRRGNVSEIKKSIETYSNTIRNEDLNAEEVIYATEQLGRLYVYWGHISNGDAKEQIKIGNECLQQMQTIAPDRSDVGENPQYFYWHTACLMARSKAEGPLSVLKNAKAALNALKTGISIDQTYEGGGFYKLSGIFYYKLPKINPFGPGGDIKKSLEYFRRALDASVYDDVMFPDWKDADTETGDYFYETYFYYGEALVKAGKKADAKDLVTDALQRIADEDLPVGREPETEVAAYRMKELLKTL